MKFSNIEYSYPHWQKQFNTEEKFDYVQIAKHKGTNGKKILLVLDYMPTEDLYSGKLLSGITGTLLERLMGIAKNLYKAKYNIDDYSWIAISYNSFRTVGKSDDFRHSADKAFAARCKHIICEYRPNIVLTFGSDPFRALAEKEIEYVGNKACQWMGVPIETSCESQDKKHSFTLVSTVSCNTLINTGREGSEIAIAGYVARNITNALEGSLKYRIPKSPKYRPVLINTLDKFDKMMAYIRNKKRVAIDTETDNLNRIKNKVLTIQFATNVKRAFVLPIYHKDSPFLPKELKYIVDKLRDYFEYDNNNEHHVYTNAVFDLNVMRQNFKIRYYKNWIWDIFAGEFAHDENMKYTKVVIGHYYYSLLNISMQYGCTAYHDAEFGKDKRKTISTTNLDDALIHYCCLDVIIPLYIMEQQIKRAEDTGYTKYRSVVDKQISDMLHVFNTLEHNGCPTDIDYLFFLKSKQSPLRQKLESLLNDFNNSKGAKKANALLQSKSGCPTIGLFGRTNEQMFNIRKEEHLQTLFFDVLKLKPTGNTKKGGGNIDKEFQATYSSVPEVEIYTKITRLKKLMNAYVNAFIKQWGTDDDMRHDRHIRPFFQFLTVVTGRTSATKPSLHQIPSRSEDGKYIKRLFISEPGRILIKIDFAAHEVRCLHLDSYVSTEIGMVKLKDLIEMPEMPLVKSFNHKTGEVEFKAVGTKSVHPPEEDMYEIEYEGGTISVTGNHKIWSKTRNEYVRADSIEEGEELLIDKMKTVKVKAIKKITAPEFVCDIGIEDNHNLFVCDDLNDKPVLVHNCWSLITGDKNVADVFRIGYDLRNKFKLRPSKKLAKQIDEKGDVHKINAAYFFGVDIAKVTKEIRQAVKSVIFGLIYQQGDKGLAHSTGRELTEIKKLKVQFLDRFPVGVKWFDKTKQFAKKHLFVESPIGRRRHLWQFILPKNAKNAEAAIAKAERLAVNSPVQGLGSDYLIIGSRNIERLKYEHYEKTDHYPDFYQSNSVHDSISMSCAHEDFWLAINIIEQAMTTEVERVNIERHGKGFIIPLEIDFEVGATEKDIKSWNYDLRKMEEILKYTLTFQKNELNYDVDVEETCRSIMEDQYEYMPKWAQNQYNYLNNKKGAA